MTARALADLAATMRQQLADRNGYRTLSLSRGLELVLVRADQRWTLTIKRPNVPPSETEISVIRHAFGVPIEPGTRAFKRALPSPKTGQIITYHGIELTWREV